jgi:hypothetical protein
MCNTEERSSSGVLLEENHGGGRRRKVLNWISRGSKGEKERIRSNDGEEAGAGVHQLRQEKMLPLRAAYEDFDPTEKQHQEEKE